METSSEKAILDAALTTLAATFSIATHRQYSMWLERYEGIEEYYGKKETFCIEGCCMNYSFDIEPLPHVIAYLEKAWECLLKSWEDEMEELKRAEREREEWERKARECSKRKRKNKEP